MASYQSIATTTWASGTSVTVSTPSGLAVGDFMVAHVSMNEASTRTKTLNLLSGWTSLANQTANRFLTGRVVSAVFYKVADSSDVSGGSFTFTQSGSAEEMAGAVYRITGVNTVSQIDVYDADASTGGLPASYSSGVTPTYANSLFIFLVCAGSGDTPINLSSLAITTDNPTWTSDYNLGSGDHAMTSSHATRTPITATGNYGFSGSDSLSHVGGIGVLLVVLGQISETVSPDALTLTSTHPTVALQAGSTVSPDSFSLTSSLSSPQTEKNNWNNIVKSSPLSWYNEDKSFPSNSLLLENGDSILLEDGYRLLLENDNVNITYENMVKSSLPLWSNLAKN